MNLLTAIESMPETVAANIIDFQDVRLKDGRSYFYVVTD